MKRVRPLHIEGVVALFFACALLAAPAVKAAEKSETAATAHSTRIVLLGTGGGPIVRKYRAQPANLLVVDGKPYLIDTGDGVVRQLDGAGVRPQQIGTIFITHHHADHNAGLEPLMGFIWLSRQQNAQSTKSVPAVQIYGPPATEALVRSSLDFISVAERIFNHDGAMSPAAPAFEAHDISKDGLFYRDDNVHVTAAENSHYHHKPGSAAEKAGDKSYSYRFDTPAGSVVFSGDTGPSKALTKLARGADVLVTEVIDLAATETLMANVWRFSPELSKSMAYHMAEEHLTPEEIGKMASEARVKMVVLTHFSPGLDAETDMTGYTAGVKKYFSGPVIAGKDLYEHDLFKR